MTHQPTIRPRFRPRFGMLAVPSLLAAALATALLTAACAQQESAPPAGTTPPAAQEPAAQKPAEPTPAQAPIAGPIQLVMETERGVIVADLFKDDAPKSVEHIVRLAQRGFYRNQRVHRVVPGQIVQFGDPQSRDGTLREWWGRGPRSGSGQPIGVAEISKTRKHREGALGLAHAGDAAYADSQLYITLRDMPNLDGKFTIIGQVTSGLPAAGQIKVGDMVKQVTARAASGT